MLSLKNSCFAGKKLVLVFSLLLILSLRIFSQQDFWQQSNGPYTFGGLISCMNLDNNGVLYVGSMDNGVYRTTDLGDQ